MDKIIRCVCCGQALVVSPGIIEIQCSGCMTVSFPEVSFGSSSSTNVFVRGEEVEVRCIGSTWIKATYYGTIEGEKYPYLAKSHKMDCYVGRQEIRKLPKQEAGPKVFYIEKDVDDFVKGYSVPQRSIIQAAAIKDFLKSKNLLDFDEE